MRIRTMLALVVASSLAHSAVAANCTAASYSRLRPPRYPPEAVKDRVAGRVMVVATVGVDGVPRDIFVEKSSGNPSLDDAAKESVAEWRFNPARCDGKAIASNAVVPVDFSLDDATPPTMQDAAQVVTADDQPMELGTANEELAYLRQRADLKERSFAKGYMFSKDMTTWSWLVLESSDGGWNAVDGGWRAIFRVRLDQSQRPYRALYAYVCDGPSEWCSATLEQQVGFLKANPMPVPPPLPQGSDASVGR